MKTIQTKETSPALSALLKAKGQRGSVISAAVEQPAAVVIENTVTEIPATQEETPATDVDAPVVPATPFATQESTSRYSEQVYHDFRVHHDKKMTEKNAEIQQLKDALSKATAPKIEFPKTKEEMDEFKKTNTEAYDMIRSIALQTALEQDAELQDRLAQINATQQELREKEAFGELLKAHPDAKEIRESVEFAKWFNEQPDAIKNTLANSNDVKSIIKLLTLYKVEALGYNPKENKKAATKSRVDASLAVDVKSKTEISTQKKIWTRSEINAVCANYGTWTKYKDEIDNARREGRVDETK